MLVLQDISYIHPNKNLLFTNVQLTVGHHQKIALTGNNGSGKSTLLKIIAKELQPLSGQIQLDTEPYYVPQIYGQYNHLTIAQALQVNDRLNALKAILSGDATEKNYSVLNDDWAIEARCQEALSHWQLTGLDLSQKMETLSGGQKAKVLLAGIAIRQPGLMLLDEPSNHLDTLGREALYSFIQSYRGAAIVVSHDRKLLNLLDPVCELSHKGITIYGGNYDFYAGQKQLENEGRKQQIHSTEKALHKAREKERETLERQQKLDARGKKKQEKAGIARIMMNTLKNKAENSTAKLRSVHTEKTGAILSELKELRNALPGIDKMKLGFCNTDMHPGKTLFSASGLNYGYNQSWLWKQPLHLHLGSGERMALKGSNGSGKTTLIKLLLGQLQPMMGSIYRAKGRWLYADQDYSLIDPQLSVYELARSFNTAALEEHEIKIKLSRFLFTQEDWNKSCSALSGGERMRLMLCCLTIFPQPPDVLILDEPTNNLDLQNIEILEAALQTYRGLLIVVSHDEIFLQKLHITRTLHV